MSGSNKLSKNRLKDALEHVFDADKKLLLVETGLQTVEKMLKEQYEIASNELLEKKVKLEGLKKQNAQSATKIRDMNNEIESRRW